MRSQRPHYQLDLICKNVLFFIKGELLFCNPYMKALNCLVLWSTSSFIRSFWLITAWFGWEMIMLNQINIPQGNLLKVDTVIREFGNQVKNFCLHAKYRALKTCKQSSWYVRGLYVAAHGLLVINILVSYYKRREQQESHHGQWKISITHTHPSDKVPTLSLSILWS